MMPSWFHSISESIKQKCYVYLIQRYFGQFFEEKLDPKQLKVDLYNGTCALKDIGLDVQALNELADKQNWPLEFVDGFIERVNLTVPWSSLLSESSVIEVTGLRITMQPKQRSESATSMFESMWTSMTSSLQLARECQEESSSSPAKPYDGLQCFANTIDSILARIKVRFVDSVFQLENVPKDSRMGVGIILNIDLITYTDESGDDPPPEPTSSSPPEDDRAYAEKSRTSRTTSFEGVTVSTMEFSNGARTCSGHNLSGDSVYTDADSSLDDISETRSSSDRGEEPEEATCERNVVLFARFGGQLEVVVRLKHTEKVEGPKVSIEMDVGSLLVFLSPRQLRVLIELGAGLASPDMGDHSNIPKPTYAGKPMSSSDYERVERDLQQQLTSPYGHIPQIPGFGHGWTTGTGAYVSEEEFDDDFLPPRGGGMYDSAMSECSTMDSSSLSSSVTSTCCSAESASRTMKRINKLDTDPTAEISRFQIRANTLGVILLHEDLLNEALDGRHTLVPSSVAQMQGVAQKFFADTNGVLKNTDFKVINVILDRACTLNHLRVLASPLHIEGDEKTTNSAFSIGGYLEATKLEFTECLHDNDKTEHVDLINFEGDNPRTRTRTRTTSSDSSSTSSYSSSNNLYNTARPNLKVTFKHVERTRGRHRASKAAPKTDLTFSLNKCAMELDITILDRITALLNPQTICRVANSNAPNNPWGVSNSNDGSAQIQSTIDFKVTSPSVTVKIRFPRPDFRPPHDMTKIPWWKRNVRPDFLTAVLTNATFRTSLNFGQILPQEYALDSRNVNIYYQEDYKSMPVHIARGGFEDKHASSLQDVWMDCKLNIKVMPPRQQGLENPAPGFVPPESMASSMGGYFQDCQLHQTGPFTSKRVIYESDTPHQKRQTDDDSKELLVPGEKAEIADFIRTTTESARIRVDISIPSLSMQLISKHLFEIVYNRINNDLLLWEPSAPRNTPSPAFDTATATTVNLDDSGNEVFQLCKSGIHFESESDSDDGNQEDEPNVFFSTCGSTRMKVSQTQAVSERPGESNITIKLHIARGAICMFTPVRDQTSNNVIPGQQGEFLVNVEGATVFVVNGYMGDADLGFVCVELPAAQLHHCEMDSIPSQSPPLKDSWARSGSHMHSTIYGSEQGMMANVARGNGGGREMLTLCIKIQASHETHHVKNVSLAVGLNKVTLRHKMSTSPNSWLTQLVDFFNVQDYPIPGYQAKEILTEIFVHFWDAAIDYRPRHLPMKAAITLSTFSISSHLSAEVNTSTLRFIAEECGLYLSVKGGAFNKTGPVDLRRDYVNVIELGLFEISLKTSDKKNTEIPHFDLRASNNMINIRTCADSALALGKLLKYFACDGDLLGEDLNLSGGSTYSSPRHTSGPELVSVDPQESGSLSESQQQQIHEQLLDALQDEEPVAPSPSPSQANQEFYSLNGAKLFYFPDEKQSEAATLPMTQVTTELGRSPFQHYHHQPQSISDTEDDFCFIDREQGFDNLPRDGKPVIKWLTSEPIRTVENHFCVPSEKSDPLRAPKNFPTPTMRSTLCEMSIIWQIYGGKDFESEGTTNAEAKKKNVNFSDASVRYSPVSGGHHRVSMSSSPRPRTATEGPPPQSSSTGGRDHSWIARGGRNRDHAVLMEFQMNKIRFRHETYPDGSNVSSRQVVIVSDLEVRDRLKCSQMNKFLYEYTSQEKPKQTNANMLLIKTLFTRPDLKHPRIEECSLKVSLLPLRLNIDQDALQFLIVFFTELGGDSSDPSSAAASARSTPVHQPPVVSVTEEGDDDEDQIKEEAKKIVDENLLILLEEHRLIDDDEEEFDCAETGGSDSAAQNRRMSRTSISEGEGPIYFRKVVFSPDVHIRLDYQGKRVDLTHGPLQGLLMGLAQLNCSELRLKRIVHRHGLLGFDKLLAFLLKEWLNDIKRNQIPSLLVGVGPLHCFVQLFQGVRDLFCLPFEQYKKDGRFFRGLHRGANSFTTSTAMAALELTTRLIHLIQLTAETAFDMLTPGPSVRINPRTKVRRKRLRQPKDIREGVTNAYKVMKEGIEETADNIVQVASHEHEHKGYAGAVGGVIRQIPPTIIKPIIIASEATSNVLGGMKCQLIPDAREETSKKWRMDDPDSML